MLRKQAAAVAQAEQLFAEGIFSKAELDCELALISGAAQGRAEGAAGRGRQASSAAPQPPYHAPPQFHPADAHRPPQANSQWVGGAQQPQPHQYTQPHQCMQPQGTQPPFALARPPEWWNTAAGQVTVRQQALDQHNIIEPEAGGAAKRRAGPVDQSKRGAGIPQPNYYECLGYKCPYCQRDFSQTTWKARNGAFSRHMTKCASEQVGPARGAARHRARLAGRGARPSVANDVLGGSSEGSRTCATGSGSGQGQNGAADGTEQTTNGGRWWVRGSEYLGRRVRRAVYDEKSGDIVGAADGEIVGWLPLEVSDFVSEFFQV